MSTNPGAGQDFAQRLADVFRLYVGEPHEKKRFTRAVLAEATGINPNTLKSYIRGEHALPASALLALLKALPTEAGNMLIADSGYRLAPIDPNQTNWDGLAAEAAGLVGEICTARADGAIDHQEAARLKARTRKLIADAQGAVSEG